MHVQHLTKYLPRLRCVWKTRQHGPGPGGECLQQVSVDPEGLFFLLHLGIQVWLRKATAPHNDSCACHAVNNAQSKVTFTGVARTFGWGWPASLPAPSCKLAQLHCREPPCKSMAPKEIRKSRAQRTLQPKPALAAVLAPHPNKNIQYTDMMHSSQLYSCKHQDIKVCIYTCEFQIYVHVCRHMLAHRLCAGKLYIYGIYTNPSIYLSVYT